MQWTETPVVHARLDRVVRAVERVVAPCARALHVEDLQQLKAHTEAAGDGKQP